MSRLHKRHKIILLTALVLAMGIAFLGEPIHKVFAVTENTYRNLKIFTHVLDVVQENYVEEVEPKTLLYGAIKGMLETLDPHSTFMPPEIYKELQVETRGSFGGLGIEITIRDGVLTVISPIEDTPAARAGVKSGDQIMKIDGESTKNMSLMDSVKKMRGPKGAKITISIRRKGVPELLDFTITRDIIQIKSVRFRMLDKGIGYIRLTSFQEKTAADLRNAMDELIRQAEGKMGGLILDVRNNPGGLLDQAVEVADAFIESGLVVYTDGRIPSQKMKFKATKKNTYTGFPLVVIVNNGSASASEIVAGALQDHHRAVILGTKTFGKGSVQTIIPLEDGSGLRLTTSRYFTPNGKSIQAVGIKPDIVVEQIERQEESAVPSKTPHLVRERDLERHLEPQESEPEVPKDMEKEQKPEIQDAQLERALEMLKSWRIFATTM
ncbi:MAG: S41 family peptidase [Deltaproteobacteria bacterium]|nr:S41 family peptidase [Deltaproteobacteria bacterium]